MFRLFCLLNEYGKVLGYQYANDNCVLEDAVEVENLSNIDLEHFFENFCCYTYENGSLSYSEKEIKDYENEKAVELKNIQSNNKLNEEYAQIQTWFKQFDYYSNKIITGEWSDTDSRWLEYLEQRAMKRKRQDEILKLLKNEEKNNG